MKQFFLGITLLSCFFSFSQVPNKLTPSEKVYGLSKLWQEVNYNFVYLEKIDKEKWNKKYQELIAVVQNTKNDYEYYRELQKFYALLNDGHTNVFFPQGIQQMTTTFGEYRIFLENIDGRAIVVRTNLSKKDEIPFGSEVIEVNGKPTEKYIQENVAPYISSSTDYVLKDWCISRLLIGLEGESYHVKIKKPDNKIIELVLTHKLTAEKEVYPAFEPSRQLLDFRWIGNEIAYVALNSFQDIKIDSLFIEKLPELYNAKALIIDLRNNGGGKTEIGTTILQYLVNDKVLFGAKSASRLHIPTFKAWGKFTQANDTLRSEQARNSFLNFHDKYYYPFKYKADTIKLNAKRVVVPTALLIGHKTGSAAEDFLIFADNQKHMLKIGENSFGSTGQPFTFDLPGGGTARVCTKKDTYPDGREFVGYGIKPDIIVKTTLDDIFNKKDPVVDKAVEYLKKKFQ